MEPPSPQEKPSGLYRRYQYRIYPTRPQIEAFEQQLREACDLYNAALEHRKWMWKSHRLWVTWQDQSAEMKHMRAEGLLDRKANFWSQRESSVRRGDRAFHAFLDRLRAGEKPGYPRYKIYKRFNTLEWSFAGNAGGVKLMENGRLRVQGVGEIKVKWHRPIPEGAKPCQATVTRKNGRWYVTIALKDVPRKPLPKTGQDIGIDLGITTFAKLSDDTPIEGPRAWRTGLNVIRRADRRVSRRKRGSNRRKKAGVLLARHREREMNRRRDHAHKTAANLVERFDTICVEKLRVAALGASVRGGDVYDQGWTQFVHFLCEKAEEASHKVAFVDPKNTSQECSACGALVPKTLAERIHRCACGYVADRDTNAARNILKRGLETGSDGAVR